MNLKVFTVDAFTKAPFSGNPAAVMPLDQSLSEETLQKIAKEINLSETAYLTPPPGGSWSSSAKFGLRWFTPLNEVILCGHATLASAHTLFEELGNTSDCLEFETLSGTLLARRNKDEGSITLDLPDCCPSQLSDEQRSQFEPIVKLVKDAGFEIQDVEISTVARKLLVRIRDDSSRMQFESFQLNNDKLLALHDGSIIKGLIVTKKGHGDDYPSYDFVSRYFAVWNGIPEDPVTGSAHTVLGPYWKKNLKKAQLDCRQCSPRGGDLTVTVREDGRIDLAGHATTVITGTIKL